MNLRWLKWDYVPPDLPLTVEQRRHVRWKILWAFHRPTAATRGAIFLWVFVAVPVFLTGKFVILPFIREFHAWLDIGGAHLVWNILFFWLFAAWIGRIICWPRAAREIRSLGFDICPSCGYWLRGLTDGITRCPECGAAREAMPDDSIATEGSS